MWCSRSAVGLSYDRLMATDRGPPADCRVESVGREGRETFPRCATAGSGSARGGEGRLEAQLPLANHMTCRLALSAQARSVPAPYCADRDAARLGLLRAGLVALSSGPHRAGQTLRGFGNGYCSGATMTGALPQHASGLLLRAKTEGIGCLACSLLGRFQSRPS
jgi:hypothetical protein